jgi:hypothetical protein
MRPRYGDHDLLDSGCRSPALATAIRIERDARMEDRASGACDLTSSDASQRTSVSGAIRFAVKALSRDRPRSHAAGEDRLFAESGEERQTAQRAVDEDHPYALITGVA